MLCALISFSLVGCDDDDDDKTGVPTEVVSALSFTDTDLQEGLIGGTLNWTAPASVSTVTKYVIYQSEDGKAKGKNLGNVSVGTNSFQLTEGTDYASYLIVVIANDLGEATVVANVKVTDLTAEPPTEPAPTVSGVYILNSGKMGSNNASLSFYNTTDAKTETDVFKTQNGRGLGDTAQDMLVYGDKMYIAVYNSGTIEVTDLAGKSIKQIKAEDKKLQPRGMTSHNGNVYITLYDGYVARLDTASLEIDQTIAVGRNPEQIVATGNKLYVANSGGLDYNTEVGYDKTVSVIDITSFTETKKLDVIINPNHMEVSASGLVYLISWGNYGDVPNTLQCIDSATDQVSAVEVTNATYMTAMGDKLYMIYSQYDANWNQTISYYSYDTLKGELISDNFITDNTTIAKPYRISSDLASGHIFITESDYKNNGDLYIFTEQGTLVDKVEVGLNPIKAVAVAY